MPQRCIHRVVESSSARISSVKELDMTRPYSLKLSICIGTFNRADFIGATLESIVDQMTNDCEIVVSDNASTDGTEQVVSEFARRSNCVRYVKQDVNYGLDRNFDRVVELARGEYCWLMSDDDLMKPGAVAHVLEALRRDVSLVMVGAEIMDRTMSTTLAEGLLDFETDRLYGSGEMDRLFLEVNQLVILYIGGVVIKRAIWLDRDREKYYGSLFIHVGVIFQRHLPGDTLVIAKPLINYRLGNSHSFASKNSSVFLNKCPSLAESMALTESSKRKWSGLRWLPFLRGSGDYSLSEYRLWIRPRFGSFHERAIPLLIAFLPCVLVNAVLAAYYSIRRDRRLLLYAIKQSRFHWRNFLRSPSARPGLSGDS
jgi:abequosyltransferase